MSTTESTRNGGSEGIDVLPNDEDGTVTFVADDPRGNTLAPTEWITIDADAVLHPEEFQ